MSSILQKDREEAVALSKRLTPEERLVAYYHHSRLMAQMYRAGAYHRAHRRRPLRER